MFTFHDALQGLHAHVARLLEGARLAALGCCTASLDANFAQAQSALSQIGEQVSQDSHEDGIPSGGGQ